MTNGNDDLKARMREIGRRGGLATSKKYGPEHYAEISPMGGRATKGIPKRKRRKVPAPVATPKGNPLVVAALDEILADLEGHG